MLHIKEDKNRPYPLDQIFVELTKNRDISITDCDRLGYWCDKGHLSHFMLELARVYTNEELKELFKNRL